MVEVQKVLGSKSSASTASARRRIQTAPEINNGPRSIGKSRGGRWAKIRMIVTNARPAMISGLSGGQVHDAPEGRALLESRDKLAESASCGGSRL